MNYSFKRKLQMYINSSVVLIFFTVAAMVCANIPGVKDWYASFWTQEVSLAIGDFNFFSIGLQLSYKFNATKNKHKGTAHDRQRPREDKIPRYGAACDETPCRC